MKFVKKVIFSIVPVLILLFVVSDFFVTDLIDFELYEKIWWVMLVLTLLFYIFLLKSIWSRNLIRDKKVTHTVLCLFFIPYSLYYIWVIDAECH